MAMSTVWRVVNVRQGAVAQAGSAGMVVVIAARRGAAGAESRRLQECENRERGKESLHRFRR